MNTAWNRWCRNLPSGTALSLYDNHIDLIRALIFDYVIHFRMAKAHECPLAAVCMGVCEEA